MIINLPIKDLTAIINEESAKRNTVKSTVKVQTSILKASHLLFNLI